MNSSTQPDANGCELDEGKIVGCERVRSDRDSTALLDLVVGNARPDSLPFNVREFVPHDSRPRLALESCPDRCLQPQEADDRHFRDYPTGHAWGMQNRRV